MKGARVSPPPAAARPFAPSPARFPKSFFFSLAAHSLLLSLIVLFSGCPKKIKEVQIVENVKIISAPRIEAKKEPSPAEHPPPPPKEEKKSLALPEPKPKAKPKPKPEKQKKVVETYKSDLRKRLEEKLRPDEPTPPKAASTDTSSTSIRGDIKENWYLALLKSKIESCWQQPSRVLMKGRGRIALTVSFSLQKDGSAHNISIPESSGLTFVDMSALQAVKMASPFPPIPESTSSRAFELAIDFILKE